MPLSLVQLLVKLLEHRKEVSKDNFSHFIEPIFRELTRIHEDYSASLREIKKKASVLASPNSTDSAATASELADTQFLDFLREKQAGQAHLRVLVAELVRVLPKAAHEQNSTTLFVASVREYLHYMAGELLYGDLHKTETVLGASIGKRPTRILQHDFFPDKDTCL